MVMFHNLNATTTVRDEPYRETSSTLDQRCMSNMRRTKVDISDLHFFFQTSIFILEITNFYKNEQWKKIEVKSHAKFL